MLVAAEPFISRNIHPTVIVRACYKALESALRVCREIAVPIDIYNRDEMMKLLRSTIGTKFSSRFGDLIVPSIFVAFSLLVRIGLRRRDDHHRQGIPPQHHRDRHQALHSCGETPWW